MKRKKASKETDEEMRERWQKEEEDRQRAFDEWFASNSNTEWLAADERHGYVYIVECDWKYKIGVARDVRQRIREMQTGNPNPLVLKDAVIADRAQALEQILHGFFEEHRNTGEWHDINADQLADVVRRFKNWTEHVTEALERVLD